MFLIACNLRKDDGVQRKKIYSIAFDTEIIEFKEISESSYSYKI